MLDTPGSVLAPFVQLLRGCVEGVDLLFGFLDAFSVQCRIELDFNFFFGGHRKIGEGLLLSSGFFEDESGELSVREAGSGVFHALLEVFKHHHVAEDDAEGLRGVDVGGFRRGKDAFPQGSRRLVQGGVFEAGLGEFRENPFQAVFRIACLLFYGHGY